MKNLRMLVVIIVVVGVFVVSGCTDAGDMFARQLGETMVQQAVISGVRNEIEGPRGTVVNVAPKYNNVAPRQSSQYNGIMTDGGSYQGTIFNQLPHGYGTYVWPSGDRYVGQFLYGKKNGQGTLTFPDGGKYIGQFKDNKVDGQGTLTFPDGIKYIGQFKDNKADGQGTLTFPDGGKYIGQFKDDMIIGQGTYYMLNGNFVGEMREGRAYKGKFTGDDGTVMVGIFSAGTKAGIIDYPDGRKYAGEWNGDPEFMSTDEVVVLGNWTYERPHGVGKMIYPDGKVEEGIWSKGRFLGKLAKD